MLPSRWMDLLQYDIIGDKIRVNFQNACCTPIEDFVEGNERNWHPRTHGPRNYLQSFYLAALIHKCREKIQYPYAEFRNFIGNKRTRSFQKEMITMKLLRLLLMMKRHPNIRKVLDEIKMPSSMNLWSGNVVIF